MDWETQHCEDVSSQIEPPQSEFQKAFYRNGQGDSKIHMKMERI